MFKILFGGIAAALVLFSLYLYIDTNKAPHTYSSEQAINLVKDKYPELNDYPSDNLPPKTIETEVVDDEWLIGFYTWGSGLPGILKAECYSVSNNGLIAKTGEFSASGGGPQTLNLSDCTSN
jgi:hypothetical protein